MIAVIYKSLLFCYLLTAPAFTKTAVRNVNAHPLHVSTSDISYNAQDGKLEIICTIFTDDFESALAKQYQTKTDLMKPDMHKAMDELVKKYISTNLHIKAGDKDTPVNYLGYQINREATEIYLESEKINPPKKIEAKVSILHNLYTDQLSIVHMTVSGTRKSGKLEYPAQLISQSF